MRVGIFIFKGEPEATVQAFIGADLCLRSIRKHMPGVHVTQLTDDVTPEIPGVDKVLRRPACPLATLRTFWQSALDGDWVFCDADVVFQEDLRPLFEGPGSEFYVALADRQADGPHPGGGMEHNVGVVYSRSREFWREIHERVKALPLLPGVGPRSQSDWFADQIEVNALAHSGRYRVRRLLPRYNYAPHPDGSDVAGAAAAAVVHYKGPHRKALLMARVHAENAPRTLGEPPAVVADPGFGRLPVFIGYDQRQPLAHNVAAHSVASRASSPVAITRLQLSQLPMSARGLTEFTFSRFLAPWLCGFEGWSIFMDADVLCLGDVWELARAAWRSPPAAVHVVRHEARPFERASVMVFDNARCKILTPEYVQENAKKLLGLGWASSVGLDLPAEWNHLVGYDTPRLDAKLVHFTMGVPCWPETANSEYAAAWQAELQNLQSTCTFRELMGNSVHVPYLKAMS